LIAVEIETNFTNKRSYSCINDASRKRFWLRRSSGLSGLHWVAAYDKDLEMVELEKDNQIDRFKDAALKGEANTSDDALDKITDNLDLIKKPEANENTND